MLTTPTPPPPLLPFVAMLTAPLRRAAFRSSVVRAAFARSVTHFRAMSTDQKPLTYGNFPFLKNLGINESNSGVFNGTFVAGEGEVFTSVNPATNEPIARITTGSVRQFESCVEAMDKAKPKFSNIPIPVRGELVRQIGEALRAKKADLGALVSLEMGKIAAEGLGEVQEAIDICDYGTGNTHTRKSTCTHATDVCAYG